MIIIISKRFGLNPFVITVRIAAGAVDATRTRIVNNVTKTVLASEGNRISFALITIIRW